MGVATNVKGHPDFYLEDGNMCHEYTDAYYREDEYEEPKSEFTHMVFCVIESLLVKGTQPANSFTMGIYYEYCP